MRDGAGWKKGSGLEEDNKSSSDSESEYMRAESLEKFAKVLPSPTVKTKVQNTIFKESRRDSKRRTSIVERKEGSF